MGVNGVERERKFVVKMRPARLSRYPHERIEQGYLAAGGRGRAAEEVRIRRVGRAVVLTVKRGGGRSRREVEVPLRTAAAARLWALTTNRRVFKTRYRVPSRGGAIE